MRAFVCRELTWFVLTRGLVLCALLLAGTAAMLLRAGEGGPMAVRFYEYAGVFRFAALTTFAGALLGSLLTEDMLRYYGK